MAAEEGTQSPPLNPVAGLGAQGWFPAKKPWSELIGETSEEAQKKILEGMPGAVVEVIPPNHTVVTMDYRTNRLRIYTDSAGKVARVPEIG